MCARGGGCVVYRDYDTDTCGGGGGCGALRLMISNNV